MKKRLVFCLFIVLAIAALLDPAAHSRAKHLIWLIQGVAAFAAVAVFVGYMRLFYNSNIKSRAPRDIDDIAAVPENEAYELQKVAGKIRMSAVQARILALAILEPGELRQRVVENYRPNQRTLDQEVTVEAKVPVRLLRSDIDSPANTGGRHAINPDERLNRTRTEAGVLFPVLVIPKGVFNDNLEVFGPDGSRVPVLTYREYLQVTASVLRLLLCLAYGISTAGSVSNFSEEDETRALETNPITALETNPLHLEHRALCEIIKRAKATADVKKMQGVSPVSSQADEVAGLLEKLVITDERNRIYLKLAAALVRKLSLHYALVAATELPADRRLFVRYRRTLVPELQLWSGGQEANPRLPKRIYKRSKSWLRVLFGARPVNVTVSLDNAWTCRSYHVRVEAPEGLYLAGQKLIASEQYLAMKAADSPTPPHYRFRRRLGQSYAHFYGRFFPIPLPRERRPKIQLDFYQIPPGSDFRAAIASCSAFALIWLVGFVLSRNRDPGTDAPAFLLVFPGIAASWLGFDTTTHQLFDGTLAARLSLALTVLTSVGASGAFILSKSDLHQMSMNMPSDVSVLGVYRWPWAILVVVAFTNTIYMGCRWIRHSWRFKRLAERPDSDFEY